MVWGGLMLPVCRCLFEGDDIAAAWRGLFPSHCPMPVQSARWNGLLLEVLFAGASVCRWFVSVLVVQILMVGFWVYFWS